MQAILKAPLYKRSQPTNEVAASGYLPAGSVVNVESMVQGKAIDGNSTWVKATDGFHYWADDSVMTRVPIAFDPTKMSWGHRVLDIPGVWAQLGTSGAGCLVAVIDTGVVATNPDLSPNIHSSSKSFVTGDTTLTDQVGHGTNMAGIIAATGKNIVYGVAPEAQLLVLKVSNQAVNWDVPTFVDALNYAANNKNVDIISISYGSHVNDPRVSTAIQTCIDNKKIVVAAIGDNHNPMANGAPDRDLFPACYNTGAPPDSGVLAVGAFDISGVLCIFSGWSPHLGLLAPGDDSILTTGPGNVPVNGGETSIATAFTAGCLALMVSYNKVNNSASPVDCVKALRDTCDAQGGGFSIQSGYGKIDLKNAIQKILKKT